MILALFSAGDVSSSPDEQPADTISTSSTHRTLGNPGSKNNDEIIVSSDGSEDEFKFSESEWEESDEIVEEPRPKKVQSVSHLRFQVTGDVKT